MNIKFDLRKWDVVLAQQILAEIKTYNSQTLMETYKDNKIDQVEP